MQYADSKASNNNCDSHIKPQISKVIIRLEIDDLNKPTNQSIESLEAKHFNPLFISKSSKTDFDQETNSSNYSATTPKDIPNSSNRNIFELFTYNCN